MKLIIILATLTLSACGPWSGQKAPTHRDTSDYRLIAGIRSLGQGADIPNPAVDSALRKAGIQFFYGDHSSRLTQLYCLREDFEEARAALEGLQQSDRTTIVLFDS